jgi:enoyl-CoA hydratase/carnithine racemase
MRAAEGARIGQIEAQPGGIRYAGGTQRKASRVGAARAAEMALTGAVDPPETPASRGLINRVLPAGCLAGERRSQPSLHHL